MVDLTRAKDAALNWVRPPARGTTTESNGTAAQIVVSPTSYSAASSASHERRMDSHRVAVTQQ
jgi:hypothetical protein